MIREAIDAIVTDVRPACHFERPARCVVADRTFARASVRLRRKSGVGETVARSMGGAAA